MSLNLEVDFKQSFYKKTDKTIYNKAITQALQKAVLKAENMCKEKAPVSNDFPSLYTTGEAKTEPPENTSPPNWGSTGNLRGHHSSKLTNDGGEVVNNSGYASYVAFGTSRRASQNYPLAVAKELQKTQYIQKEIKNNLKNAGVLQ